LLRVYFYLKNLIANFIKIHLLNIYKPRFWLYSKRSAKNVDFEQLQP